MSDGGSRPQVVVVGSVMVDLVVYADPLPETGETVLGSAFAMGCGGKGANQAVTAHRLGADVTFVGRVGADPLRPPESRESSRTRNGRVARRERARTDDGRRADLGCG